MSAWKFERDSFRHRSEWCDGFAYQETHLLPSLPRIDINTIPVMVVRMEETALWWIVARTKIDEQYFQDIGPFDNMDQAVVEMLLRKDNA